MEFKINPYIGAGRVLLGMTPNEVQEALGAYPKKKFRKFKDDDFETDSYEWCYVYYKEPGICEAIEFHAPSSVTFNEQNLLGRPYAEVRDILKQYDDTLQFEESGLTSIRFGFGLYAPFAGDEPSEPVEGVIVFEKGYYD
ncbi:hypothetical protein SAMN04487897_107197 [Paenibacillus sp. yr247]|uniref:hypothetical protein n=1 Tax=Paenibacillus sp. yr247 TaxID=1761880 RepID=UPI00087FB32A|nr:hypothetical protein [Paenibacillus sp. yr247]SDO05116.1 hypothetical protein SAMN04487897_107197 [Paenibacillus sp. yr247]